MSELALCRIVTGAPVAKRAPTMAALAQPLCPYTAIRLYGMVDWWAGVFVGGDLSGACESGIHTTVRFECRKDLSLCQTIPLFNRLLESFRDLQRLTNHYKSCGDILTLRLSGGERPDILLLAGLRLIRPERLVTHFLLRMVRGSPSLREEPNWA